MFWSCPRCFEKSSDEVATCARCGTSRGDDKPAPPLVPPPKKLCPKCRTEVQDPPVMARFKCRSCGHDFDDYEDWVRRCRAAAYAAAGPKKDVDGSPGPEPKLLRPVALALLVAAPLNGLASLVTGSDVLVGIGIATGAFGALAGGLLLAKRRGADVVARAAASVAALFPFLLVSAPVFAGVAWLLSERPWWRHYRTKPDPAPRASRLAVLGLLLGSMLLGAAALLLTFPQACLAGVGWEDSRPPVVSAAVWLLGDQGRWFIPALLALPVVLWAASRTSRIAFLAGGSVAIILALGGSAALTASSVATVRGAIEAEATLQDRSTASLLWKLKELDPRVRFAAAWALRDAGAPSVSAPALKTALEDPNPRVRAAAANTLARLAPSAEAAAVLVEELRAGRGGDDAVEALALMGPHARVALDLLLARLAPGAVVDALAEIGAPAVPGLTAALSSPDAKVRKGAAEALRRLGTSARASAEALTKALADGDLAVRSAAASALAEVLREKSIPPLCEMLEADATSAAPAGAALCSLGERGGLGAVKEGGSYLNALRRPGIWDHLSRAPVDFDLDGSIGAILEQIAVSAVMCIEPGPGAPPLTEFRRVHGASRKRSALDVLRATDLEFVLEDDKIRILGPSEARAFWASWLAEQNK